MINNIKPVVGLQIKYNKFVYEIVEVDDSQIRALRLNADGSKSKLAKRWTLSEWEELTIESDSSEGKPSTEEGKSSDNYRDQLYSFRFNPDTQKFEVVDSVGVKIAEIDGLQGPTGRSFYEDWCAKHGKDSKDPKTFKEFEDAFKGQDGLYVHGADGLDAYEVWKSHQPVGSDLSFNAFMESLRGKPGKDGHDGRDGEVGDTWKPYLSKDGKLYFENTRTKDKTETIDIRGPQGENAGPGNDGDTWEPYISDNGHQLYFKNQHGDIRGPFNVRGETGGTGKQGPEGLSAYQLWLKEGHVGDVHDFLMWVSKNADKGADGEDGDTYIPHVEDGVLFFISSKTGKKIPGGRVIGPRGPQGKPGLDGHNIEHEYDYHDLKDFTCPIQELPERLVAPSGDLNAYGSAEQHMRETLNEIGNIREEGRKQKGNLWQMVKQGRFLREFFWWCSGADTALLRMCPTEYSKYMGIGTVIFFTALMAMISSFFAISYVFGNHELVSDHPKFGVCVGFALFWGAMIFFLDRFITNTMYSDGKVTISWLELRSALPRILISIFLGIVISAPLELKIFNSEIDEYIVSQEIKAKQQEAENASAPPSDLAPYYANLNIAKANVDNRQVVIENLNNLSEPEKKERYRDIKLVTRIAGSKRDKEGNIDYTYKTDSVINYENVESKFNADLQRATTSLKEEQAIQKDCEQKLSHQKELYIKVDTVSLLGDAGLYQRLAALHAIAYHENKENDSAAYEEWPKSTEGKRFWYFTIGIFLFLVFVSIPFTKNVIKESDTQGNPNDHVSKKHLFLKGTFVLWPWYAVIALICGYCNDSLFHALPAYIFSSVGMIMMLFILIDVSPVFYKMMLADGQYEQLHHKEKSVTQDLIRLNFAQSIAQVNNSEVGKLAPMIFSKPWEKIKEILAVARNKQREELGYGESYYTQEIEEDNKRLFKEVMDIKTAIIRASYAAWYRDMRDSILGIHKGSKNGGSDLPPGGDGGDQDSDNAETKRGGTSPDYERDPDDNHSGTPEDQFSEYERKAGTLFEEESDADEDADEVDTESEEASESEDGSGDASSDVDNDSEDSYSDEDGYAEDEESDVDESSHKDDETSEDGSSTRASAAESTHNPDNSNSEWEHVVDDESEEDHDSKK